MDDFDSDSVDDSELIAIYFRHHLERSEDDFWAWEIVDDLVRSDPKRAWSLILKMLKGAPTFSALASVAAGPLEDLCQYGSKTIAAELPFEIENNKELQYAIVGVWLDEDDEVYELLEALKRQYNLNEVNPLNNERWSETNPVPG